MSAPEGLRRTIKSKYTPTSHNILRYFVLNDLQVKVVERNSDKKLFFSIPFPFY